MPNNPLNYLFLIGLIIAILEFGYSLTVNTVKIKKFSNLLIPTIINKTNLPINDSKPMYTLATIFAKLVVWFTIIYHSLLLLAVCFFFYQTLQPLNKFVVVADILATCLSLYDWFHSTSHIQQNLKIPHYYENKLQNFDPDDQNHK